MTMNLQKILHSYKHWQDYNKQHDIGLMTLYHHQEAGKNNGSCSQIASHQLLDIEEGNKEMLDESMHFKVESQLLAGNSTKRGRGKFGKVKGDGISPKRIEDSLLMQRPGQKCRHPPHLVLPINSRKQGLLLGYYDVTQMSNLRTNRRLNQMPPLADRFIKQRRQSISQIDNHTTPTPTCQLEKSLKLMSERKGPYESLTKMIQKAAQQPIKQDVWIQEKKEKSPTKYIKTQRPTKPINYIDYKLISYCQTKMKEKSKDLRRSFRKDVKQQSKRYNTQTDSPPSGKGKCKILNELKLKIHSRTLISGRPANNNRLQEVISGFFTPVSLHRDRKHAESV